MRYSERKFDAMHLEKCSPQFKNIYGPSSVCLQLDLIREKLKGINKNQKLIFLNISELTPLSSILNLSPPKNLPLWFHEEVTLFKKRKRNYQGRFNQPEF